MNIVVAILALAAWAISLFVTYSTHQKIEKMVERTDWENLQTIHAQVKTAARTAATPKWLVWIAGGLSLASAVLALV